MDLKVIFYERIPVFFQHPFLNASIIPKLSRLLRQLLVPNNFLVNQGSSYSENVLHDDSFQRQIMFYSLLQMDHHFLVMASIIRKCKQELIKRKL